MLVAAIDKLATGNIIRDLLRLPELPGERSLPRSNYLEGERVWVPPLGRMVVSQMLGH